MAEQQLVFTPEQRALIEATGSFYVDACPGAGKTEAIVQRFIARPTRHPRKGVGLLSFTNAAIDEARQRCASDPTLLAVPNFVGTIDSFINRFLVGPTFLARKGRAPVFTDTWGSVPHSHVKRPGLSFRADLDWFEIDGRRAQLRLDRVPYARRRSARELRAADRSALEVEALRRWKSFVNRGLLSASASRVALRQYLADPGRRGQLGQILGDRFSEVIIDEVQDCCAEDLLVLQLLRDHGVDLVAVGDPDQSIYGFRSDRPADVQAFLRTLRPSPRLRGNFRSSPAICAAIDSLRASAHKDHPVGPHRSLVTPVHLVAYRRRADLRATIPALAERAGIAEEDVVVLAHNSDHARAAVGAGAQSNTSTSKLVQLAHAHHALNDRDIGVPSRSAALRTVERIIREIAADDLGHLTFGEYLAALNLSEREFRDECLRVSMQVPKPFDMPPSAFRRAVLALEGSSAALRWDARKLQSPRGGTWPSKPSDGARATAKHSTIHGLKGLQAAGVVLVLPQSRDDGDGVQQWCESDEGEERRVLYVGASRAQQLLVIAAHESVYDRVHARLTQDGVPFTAARDDGAT